MKIIEVKYDSKGKRLYQFTVNREELLLLQNMVSNTLMWTPKVWMTTVSRGRLKNIANILSSALRGGKEKMFTRTLNGILRKKNLK